jgi:hypothetical protein
MYGCIYPYLHTYKVTEEIHVRDKGIPIRESFST